MLSNPTVTPLLPRLPDSANQALDRCKRRIGGSNLLAILRNHHGFHFPTDAQIDLAFAEVPESKVSEFFLSDDGDATFYQTSEFVFEVASTQAAGEGDLKSRIELLTGEVFAAADDLVHLFSELMAVIVSPLLDDKPLAQVTLEVPRLLDIEIPPVAKA